MSKKKNKNLFMIISLATTGVVALVLLGYMIVVFFQWNAAKNKTVAIREQIKGLVASQPAPGEENEKRIQTDIDFYTEKGKGLVDNFKSPLNAAVDIFIDELLPPNASSLTDEEKELYKVEGTGTEATEDKPAVPLKIRKFTRSEFVAFFQKRFEDYCTQKNITDDNQKISLTTLRNFISECRDIFPAGNWNSAVNKFAQAARPLTYEVIDSATELPILLSALGMVRRVEDQKTVLRAQVSNMILKIEAKVSENIVANMRAELNGSEPDPVKVEAEVRHFFSDPDSLMFIGGGNEDKQQQLAVADYPMAFFHWDVFGDIASRLSASGVHSLNNVILRTKAAEGENNAGSSKINLAESFEQEGNFKLYHYTVVFHGDMNSIREVVKSFDNAWKGNKDGSGRRMYIVRSLALYAGNNGAGKIMSGSVGDDKKAQQKAADDRPSRRRRRRVAENSENNNTVVDGSQSQENRPINELSDEEARKKYYKVMKALEEEKNEKAADGNKSVSMGNIDDNRGQTQEEANYKEFEENLPEYKKFDYGKGVIGSQECKVYLDIDYVVLEQK